ncbi:glutaredoxin [Hymenobacter sp. DH14]|uniref:Glutaredoxin n=1 Tax=Hymenobacter cyanobacteriorum TaxID=2926463 RepID=A0A9X2AKD8_9BACT|nr:glutaredoxin [Hymenobacter cyanobacteriorum]MCI1189744.1 glutaredoxin [Hymenobacter cyanobacteriorum]
MKRIIEVFTAGCPLCNPVVELVKSTACSSCDVITHNLTETEAGNPALRRARLLGVQTLPAVAVNGSLLACCQTGGITKEALEAAGIGQAA